MKLVIVAVLAIVAVAVAAPQSKPAEEQVKILRSESSQEPNGPYSFSFETEDKVLRQEQGDLKQVVDEENKPQEVLAVRGSYSYVDPEGKSHSLTYVADETGFHAESDDIPQAPPALR